MLNSSFVFFGSSPLSIATLEALKIAGLLPSLIVTTPPKPQGRGLSYTATVVSEWADQHNIPKLEPANLNEELLLKLRTTNYELFIVASYGKIIPKAFLEIPAKGVLNVHPSLLPLFRGPAPIEYQILEDASEVGVSIMLLDEEVDHGPILAQKRFPRAEIEGMPAMDLEVFLGKEGGKLLAETIPSWITGEVIAKEQDHSKATFTKKIKKEDGLIVLADNPRKNYLKFLAFQPWPGIYFFTDRRGKSIRVILKAARFENGEFIIEKVLPEGGKEMGYQDFLRGLT